MIGRRSRKVSSFRDERLFEEKVEQELYMEGSIISPWVKKRPDEQPTHDQHSSQIDMKLEEFLSKVNLKTKKSKPTHRSEESTPQIEAKHYKKSPEISETTVIAFPSFVPRSQKGQTEGVHTRKKQSTELKVNHVFLNNIEHEQTRRFSQKKNNAQPTGNYNSRLFQMKWRSKELKKQRVKKSQNFPESMALKDYFDQLHKSCLQEYQHGINCNLAKQIKINKQVFIDIAKNPSLPTNRLQPVFAKTRLVQQADRVPISDRTCIRFNEVKNRADKRLGKTYSSFY